MINGMKKNNNGGAVSALRALDTKTGGWSDENRSKTEITADRKDRTVNITARNTDLAFTMSIKGDLLSIRE